MNKFKAVLFDADDTLINHKECEKQALVFMFANIGIEYKDDYQKIFRPLDRELWSSGIYNNVRVSKDDIAAFRFKILFDETGIDYTDYDNANILFKKGLAASNALTKNAEETVKYLFDMGYILCVVTNGLTELQKPRIENSRIGKYISHIIVSEETGADKPGRLIFETLLKRISVRPDEAVMIGDSLKNDVQGAKNAGIKSVWYNPGRINNDTGIEPDYEVCELLRLKELFNGRVIIKEKKTKKIPKKFWIALTVFAFSLAMVFYNINAARAAHLAVLGLLLVYYSVFRIIKAEYIPDYDLYLTFAFPNILFGNSVKSALDLIFGYNRLGDLNLFENIIYPVATASFFIICLLLNLVVFFIKLRQKYLYRKSFRSSPEVS